MKPIFALVVLVSVLTLSGLRAEDAVPPSVPPPNAPTPDASAPKTDAPKTDVVKADGDLPKAPDGKPSLNKDGETLVGVLSHGGGKGAKAKKNANGTALTLKVGAGGGKNKDKTAEKRTVTLTATGDILTQLNTLAEKKAHIKVTGKLDGDKMTVTSVSEEASKPRKNKPTA
jgi:hypothetical protein